MTEPAEQKSDPQRPFSLEFPQVVGYELLGELGRGGMATVFKARHLRLNRIVALKLLTSAQFSSPELLTRFEAEARLIAGLSAPGIVQIFEVGQSEGLPYLALEYLPGGSLARRLAVQPYTARESAQLLQQMARAVEAAHQAGVIHRDLKPANILLGSSGEPHIADFGIAKDLSAADGPTRTGEIFGTPSYMAPEQASGLQKKVGPQVDIYALGAILYELLTGRPPFRGEDPVETVLLVLTEEPVSIRRLTPGIDRDLETICSKCLNKEPRQRYPSAGDLADDLTRYLVGKPIRARPISLIQKTFKWFRRHPAWAAAISISLCSIISFTAYSVWKNRQLSQMLEERNRSLARSESNFSKAMTAMIRRITNEGAVTGDPLREELSFFDAIRHQSFDMPGGDSPAAAWERATAAGWSGMILGRLNQPKEAREAFEESIASLRQLQREHPDNSKFTRELMDVENRFGNFLTSQSDFAAAKQQFEAAIYEAESLLKGPSPQISDPEGVRDLKRDLGTMLNNLAVNLRKSGEDPAPFFQKAIEVREELARAWPEKPDLRLDLTVTRMNLGVCWISRGEFDLAANQFRNCIAALRELGSTEAQREDFGRLLVSAQLNLANCLQQSGDLEALKWYEAATGLLQEWLVRSPHSIQVRELLADAHSNWGINCLQRGDLAAGREQIRKALDCYERLLAEFPDIEKYKRSCESLRADLQEVERQLKKD